MVNFKIPISSDENLKELQFQYRGRIPLNKSTDNNVSYK